MAIKTTLKDTFELTPRGIVVHGKPSRDDAMEYAKQFIYFVGMAPLALTDLYVYLRDNFSEADAVSLVPAIGRTKHTLQNWLATVRQFPLSRRVDGLEMGHYDALCGLKTKDGLPDVGRQNELAKRAAQEGWTVGRTREEVRDLNEARVRKVVDVPDVGNADEDKPVMDSTEVGEALAAQRTERREAYAEQALSNANQMILDAVARSERALAVQNTSHAVHERLPSERLRAIGNAYLELAAIVDKANDNALRRQSRRVETDTAPKAASTEAGAGKAAGGATPPEPVSSAADDFDEIRDMPDFCRRTGDAGA